MDNKKILIYFLVILVLNFKFIDCQETTCNCFVDSQSNGNSGNGCGKVVDNACSTILDAITSCGGDYNEITVNIVPGLYNINSNGTFGVVTNKTINIKNSKSVNNNDQGVIIDLSEATYSFIYIQPKTMYDVSSISMNGLTFKNGKSLYGSVLSNDGTSTINMNIVNCIFDNNSAYNGNSGPEAGGGTFAFIKVNNTLPTTVSNVSISQCTFSNSNLGKVQTGGGGVIYNDGLLIQFTIDQCTFTNNSGQVSGGIIYSTNGYLTITNSQITKSYSPAAFFLSSILQRNPPPFYFNNVNYTNSQGGIGFAITTYSFALFENCNFKNNVNIASCIYLIQISKATIKNCLFDGNINVKGSQNSSSAITSSGSSLIIDQSVFSNNYSPVGGAINVLGASIVSNTIQISNSQFNNNSAQYGGAISDNHNTILLENVQFNLNSASVYGPSLYCIGGDTIYEISNSTFKVDSDINNNGIACLSSCSVLNSDTKKSIKCNTHNGSDDDNGGLTTGQKVGIAIGSIVLFVILVLVLIFILRKYNQSKQYKPIGL